MIPADDERLFSEFDQGTSEIEQSAADFDQAHSTSDQESSDRDQVSADHDQMAADIDQNHSDGAAGGSHEKARRMRVVSARERVATTHARHISSEGRNEAAQWRDQLAEARDIASAARDALAKSLDAEIEQVEQHPVVANGAEHNGAHGDIPQSLQSRIRTHAALQRRAAAQDRELAAKDRAAAARDRQSYGLELASLEVDELTGALRRGAGLAAVRREIERTHRTGEQLTVVFIDVDSLKRMNDTDGHAAGDALLKTVVHCIIEEFRSYDLISRVGGDEFVCAISGNGLDDVASRFERIAVRLHTAIPGATISIGITARQAEDTVESMIERADRTMIAGRQKKKEGSQ